nr:hypothetical protein [Agrobacterium tumefaciens]
MGQPSAIHLVENAHRDTFHEANIGEDMRRRANVIEDKPAGGIVEAEPDQSSHTNSHAPLRFAGAEGDVAVPGGGHDLDIVLNFCGGGKTNAHLFELLAGVVIDGDGFASVGTAEARMRPGDSD